MKKRTDFCDVIDKMQRQDKYIEYLEEEIKNLKEKLSGVTMVADDEKQSIEHILELEEDIKKLKEIIRQLLWRFLHRNIANIEYEGEEIELGE